MALDMFIDFAVAGPPVGAGTAAVLVQGESTDTTYPNTIPVIQFALGMQNATTIGTATSGTTAGKAQFQALTFTKNVDKASTGLFTACAIGRANSTELT